MEEKNFWEKILEGTSIEGAKLKSVSVTVQKELSLWEDKPNNESSE